VTTARARAILTALALVMGLAAAFTGSPRGVRADGEAGLVVQHGDGTIDSFCIAFSGDGVSGEEMLRRAAVPYEQVSGLVCSVGSRPDEGCRGASSFESCACKCRSGGSDCVYWSYFTRRYGQSWVYSAIGFAGQVARNGDLQAWRWGKAGPTSAPAPSDVTFEQVCGHAPGAAPASTVPPGATAVATPLTTFTQPAGAEPTGATAGTTAGLPTPPNGAAPASSPTPPAPSAAGPVGHPPGSPGAVIGDAAGPTAPSSSGGTRSIALFAITAAALLVAVAAAVVRRRS
jgi:hypothetical protein